MKNNNEITMLRITRRVGEAFFIDDICIRLIGFNPDMFHLLIDDKCALVKIGGTCDVCKNVKMKLTKNTPTQVRVEIFAPRAMLIAREEIAQFDKSGRLMRAKK